MYQPLTLQVPHQFLFDVSVKEVHCETLACRQSPTTATKWYNMRYGASNFICTALDVSRAKMSKFEPVSILFIAYPSLVQRGVQNFMLFLMKTCEQPYWKDLFLDLSRCLVFCAKCSCFPCAHSICCFRWISTQHHGCICLSFTFLRDNHGLPK